MRTDAHSEPPWKDPLPANNSTPDQFIDWLTGMTRALGYSRDADLARALGIDQSIVSRWRRGSRPSVEHLARVSTLTKTQLEPLLVLAGYVSADAVRQAEVPEPPAAVDPAERMIWEAPIDDTEKPAFMRYYQRRIEEERQRLAKLLALASLADDTAATGVEAAQSDLPSHIVTLFRELAVANRETIGMSKADAVAVQQAEAKAVRRSEEMETGDDGEEGTQAPDPREP
jgi:transcriptional regulator with XRE-family HTH domain